MKQETESTIRTIVLVAILISLIALYFVIKGTYDKAAVYVCHYGVMDNPTGKPEYVVSDPLAYGITGDGKGGIRNPLIDMHCEKMNDTSNYTCPDYFDSTEYKGFVIVTEKDITSINNK